jgi:deoxyribodipyrimidine photolyase-related protein
MPEIRALIIVLGDQLDIQSSAFDDFDAAHDTVWMAEVTEESTHVWSAKQRIAVFLAAMRHFAESLRSWAIDLRASRWPTSCGARSNG